MLKIAEKRINARAHKLVGEVREQFPCPDDPVASKLDEILGHHPQIAHAFLYDQDTGAVIRSQRARMQEADFRTESAKLSDHLLWIRMEAKSLVEKLRSMEQKGDAPYYFFANWPARGEKLAYQSVALFTLPKLPKDHIAIAGVVFDSELLRDQFLPAVLDSLLAEDLTDPQGSKSGGNPAVMMIHVRKEMEPLVASPGWDGGTPEVERYLEGAFPGLTLAVMLGIAAAIRFRIATARAA